MKRLLRIISATVMVVFLHHAPPAFSGTNGFVVPPFRALQGSEAGYWETFTIPFDGPGNGADKAGATTGARLTQSDTNAFLTGSGNIYNLSGVSAFTLSDETPFALGSVVLQARSIGSELDYSSVALIYSNALGAQTLAPLPRVELNRSTQPGLGATVSSLWQWDLTGLAITNYAIAFRAAEASLSFDALTLDTSSQFTPLFTQPFAVNDTAPSIERWMYANNAAPCDRPAGSAFGAFGDEAGVDTRHAQHLVGWDTASLVPTNRGPAGYLVRRCRVTLTINRGNLLAYDPTQDDFRSYLETNHPAYIADGDPGRPIELFGVGYRHGFDAASFDQCGPFGTNAPAQRNAYAAGWSTNGVLVDVSNNVGKTNEALPPFEVVPFAIGQTTNAAPGQLVPPGARITFDLNLADPFVLAYVQSAVDSGRLRLMVSSLHVTGGQFGTPAYPDFATRFNEAVVEPTRLELDGIAVADGDLDTDGLPDDWELSTLQSLTHGAASDADTDGASNLAEYLAGTDPVQASSLLRILAVDQQAAGYTTLSFPCAASRRYVVESTDNLGTWTSLTNLPVFDLPAGVAHVHDGATGAMLRCYRVRSDTGAP